MSSILPDEIPNEPLGPTTAADVTPPSFNPDYTRFVGKNVYAELITGQVVVGRLEHVPNSVDFTIGTHLPSVKPGAIARMQEV